MKYNELFILLRDHDRLSIGQLEALKTFLMDAADALEKGTTAEYNIYYSITGLFATEFANGLPDGHPLETIMTIAGELETNPLDVGTLKSELIKCIRNYAR